MRLSNQALGAIMMALQKSLLEQTDIVPILQNFTFQVSGNEELTVLDPPSFKVPSEEQGTSTEDYFPDETLVTSGSD